MQDEIIVVTQESTGEYIITVTEEVAAGGYASEAKQAAIEAVAAQQAAETAETNSETAEAGSELAQSKSEAARDAAQLAQTRAETAQGLAETAQGLSEAAAETAGQSATLALGYKNEAEQHATTAGQKAVEAAGHASDAQTAKVAAETAQGLSETAQGLSEAARDKSQKWAEETEDVEVESGKFSAKHHALKAAAAKTAAELAETNAETAQGLSESARDKSQQWAENPEDIEVETGKYSAKHWALKAGETVTGMELLSNKTQTLTNSETDYPSGKAVTDAIAVNNQTWVGVVIDPTLSSSESAPKSTVTAYRATELMRTGNLYYHKFGNSRIFNTFQLAIVDRATRKVAWYLNKNNPSLRADGTLSTPDWTTQNIAVIVPNLYRRITVLDAGTGKYEVAYDIAPFDGAQLWHEESAHSPGFASVDRTLTQLVSVVSDDARFRGGNNNGAADGLPSTQLGRPATAISRINFENYAAAAGWETGNIADRTMWHELTALYFANTNIQLDYTTTLTAEGYPQGGLGAGVTNWNSSRWNFRNGYYPIHKVGEGFMTLGCNTGVKAMTDEKYYVGAISSVSAGNLVATGHFTSGAGWVSSYIGYTVQNLQTLAEATITGKTDDNTLTLSADIFTTAGQWYWIKGVTYSYQIPVFFGLEHLYGELWDWVSGVNIEVSATVENGGTGESKAYVCTDFSKRAATITPDYTYIGLTPRTDNWIKELYRDFAIAKVNTGAGSATFMSDYGYYGNLPPSGSVVRGLLFGAAASLGVDAGVRYSYAADVPTAASPRVGARLRAKIEK